MSECFDSRPPRPLTEKETRQAIALMREIDISAAEAAQTVRELADGDTVSWEDVKRELDLTTDAESGNET